MAQVCRSVCCSRSNKVGPNTIQCTSDSSDDHSEYITIKDLEPLIPRNNSFSDKGISEYVHNMGIFQMEHKLGRLNQALGAIKEKWPGATPLQIYVAFDLAQCCTDDLILRLDEEFFKEEVQTELDRKLGKETYSTPEISEDEEEEESDGEDEEYYMSVATPIKPPKKEKEIGQHVPHVKKRRTKAEIASEPIPPTPKGVDPKEWASWSEVHRKSYLRGMGDKSAMNAFLYRNVPPGVARKNGPWTEAEKQAFLKRMKEIRGKSSTIDGRWGYFSLAIPGRVGYQCSNFYRQLIAAGEITDSKYVMGSDGKLHHTSHLKSATEKAKQRDHKRLTIKPVGQSKECKPWEVESLTFVRSNKEDAIPSNLSRYDRWALQSPYPDAIDQITNQPMKVPTLGPDGYVIDYQTWLKMISANPISPFTRMHVNKRDLIVLTTENIDQYRDKIKNM